MALAARRRGPAALGRAAVAALLGISLDLLMEPVAAARGLWSWTPPGPWLDVPIGNFVGWAVIVGAYTFGAERFADAGSAPRPGRCAGSRWRRVGRWPWSSWGSPGGPLEAERAFAGAAGWLAVLAL